MDFSAFDKAELEYHGNRHLYFDHPPHCRSGCLYRGDPASNLSFQKRKPIVRIDSALTDAPQFPAGNSEPFKIVFL